MRTSTSLHRATRRVASLLAFLCAILANSTFTPPAGAQEGADMNPELRQCIESVFLLQLQNDELRLDRAAIKQRAAATRIRMKLERDPPGPRTPSDPSFADLCVLLDEFAMRSGSYSQSRSMTGGSEFRISSTARHLELALQGGEALHRFELNSNRRGFSEMLRLVETKDSLLLFSFSENGDFARILSKVGDCRIDYSIGATRRQLADRSFGDLAIDHGEDLAKNLAPYLEGLGLRWPTLPGSPLVREAAMQQLCPPSEELKMDFAKVLRELDDESFEAREAASRRLEQRVTEFRSLIRASGEGLGAEVQMRLRQALENLPGPQAEAEALLERTRLLDSPRFLSALLASASKPDTVSLLEARLKNLTKTDLSGAKAWRQFAREHPELEPKALAAATPPPKADPGEAREAPAPIAPKLDEEAAREKMVEDLRRRMREAFLEKQRQQAAEARRLADEAELMRELKRKAKEAAQRAEFENPKPAPKPVPAEPAPKSD